MGLLGLNISIERAKQAGQQGYTAQQTARDGLERLKKAKDAHALIDQEIVENETWYRSLIGKCSGVSRARPAEPGDGVPVQYHRQQAR